MDNAMCGLILIETLIKASPILLLLLIFSVARKSVKKESVREAIADLLVRDNSSTWEIESVEAATGDTPPRMPPFRIHIWKDSIYAISHRAIAMDRGFSHLGNDAKVLDISLENLTLLSNTASDTRRGAATNMDRGLGSLDWNGIQDQLSREVLWLTWTWEHMGGPGQTSLIENNLLAVMPTNSDDHVEVAFACIGTEVRHRVMGGYDIIGVKKSMVRCKYRMITSYYEEVARSA